MQKTGYVLRRLSPVATTPPPKLLEPIMYCNLDNRPYHGRELLAATEFTGPSLAKPSFELLDLHFSLYRVPSKFRLGGAHSSTLCRSCNFQSFVFTLCALLCKTPGGIWGLPFSPKSNQRDQNEKNPASLDFTQSVAQHRTPSGRQALV